MARKKSADTEVVSETNEYADLEPDLAELLTEVDDELAEAESDDASPIEEDEEDLDTAADEVQSDGNSQESEEQPELETDNDPEELAEDSVDTELVKGHSDSGSDESQADESADGTEPAHISEDEPEPSQEVHEEYTELDSDTHSESEEAPEDAISETGDAAEAEDEPVGDTPDQSAEDDTASQDQPVARKSAWRRFLDWLRGTKPEVRADTAAPTPKSSDEGTHSSLKKQHAQKKRDLEKALKIAERERLESEKLQSKLDLEVAELERIDAWVEGLERSYFWNVRKRMQDNLATANQELAAHREAVANVSLPAKDGLLLLRQQFHKRLGVGFLVAAIPVALLFFIPWFAQASMPTWLIEFLNSQFFTIMVAGLIALTAGIVGIIRRVRGPKKMSWWRIIGTIALVIGIPLLVLGTYRAQQWLQTWVVPLIERWLAPALVFIAITFLFFLIGLLATYYSGWSRFNREVTEQLTKLDNVIDGYVHSQREVQRLESLYGQTSDWLQLLAHSLYRPWKTDSEWEGIRELQTTSETFPFALRVAHAVDSETSRIANLERLIGQRLMSQGWRAQAFKDTLAEIGQQLGFDEEHVTADLLDADLPHQTNNSRNLVRSFFEYSAGVQQTQEGSEEPKNRASFSDDYLVAVARRRLGELIETTQASVLSEARPEVEQIVEDPLQPIKFDASNLDEDRTAQDWDDFLRDAMGMTEVSEAPLSTLTFTDEGSLARDPESAETHILIPERVAASAPDTTSTSTHVHALADRGSGRSVELIVRVDVVGPIPFSHVRMVQGATQSPQHTAPVVDSDDSDL